MKFSIWSSKDGFEFRMIEGVVLTEQQKLEFPDINNIWCEFEAESVDKANEHYRMFMDLKPAEIFQTLVEETSMILGALEQSGRYIWATDTPCPSMLKFLISNNVVTFKEQQGILAIYVPIMTKFCGFTFTKM